MSRWDLSVAKRAIARQLWQVLVLTSLLAGLAVAQATTEASFPDLLRQARARLTERDPGGAVALLEKALAVNPHDGGAWRQYGIALIEMKEYRKAAAAHEKAYELGAGFPWESLYFIARCHALAGDKANAMKYLERAIGEGHRNLNMIRTNKEFDLVREEPKYRELVALPDVSAMSRDEGWRFDLRFFAREIRRLHYDPYRVVSREAFDAYVNKLHDEIPRLTEPQIVVGMMKLARMAGDGHTVIRHPAYGQDTKKLLPVQFYLFEEGLFITGAAPEQAELAGAQVLSVGGHSVEKLFEALDPVISRDNRLWPKFAAPNLLRNPYVLHGLGLIPDPDKAALTIRDAGGKERTLTLAGTAGAAGKDWVTARRDSTGPEPLYLRNRSAPYWFEYLPEQKLAWIQYNAIANDPKEAFPDFCKRVFKFINENAVEKLVVDLRWNGGGNTFLSRPLVHGLIANEKINQPGKLFVIVGRNTFSAAMNTSTLIERHTSAIFVGEPTGSSPNFIGESIRVELPYSKMFGSISDLYWQTSWPMDHRPWIAPLLHTPPTFAAYRQQRDPALEAILGYRAP
jgi:hypothetical protein